MKTMKVVNHMLRIKIVKVKEDIWISQNIYTNWMLEKFGIINYKPRSIQLSVRMFFLSNDELNTEKGKEEIKRVPYQEVLELLI